MVPGAKIFGILGKISTFATLTGRSTSKRYLFPSDLPALSANSKVPCISDRSPQKGLQEEALNARMAESVDALVSNTSGAIRAGSIPAPGTKQNASA